jgi:transcription antitermination factor NusA-like protein
VRLASKLVGWELDIYSAKQWEEKQKTSDPNKEVAVEPSPDVTPSDEDSKEEEEQE